MRNDRGRREGNKCRAVFITTPEIRKKQFAAMASQKSHEINLQKKEQKLWKKIFLM
ncbi:MAG: hypothetical protein J6Q03_08840 [Paludibacteraceae bacterium]|nr:hypothetical protein [Paludibacteraceae bacterium]